jgi:antitoxin ChpS
MTTAKLRKVGGSTMLAIPPSILDAMHLSATAAVDLSVEEGALVVKRARARYTLDQILSECDAEAPVSDEDRAWLDAPPVGREL